MTDELKAGRELDALIAEAIGTCEWDVVIEGSSRGGRHCESREEAEQYRDALAKQYRVGPIVLHADVPHYSTDIGAAWLVVEKMRERGYDFAIRLVSTWTADFYGRDFAGCSADADAAPLAICRAALKTLAAPTGTAT